MQDDKADAKQLARSIYEALRYYWLRMDIGAYEEMPDAYDAYNEMGDDIAFILSEGGYPKSDFSD